ncbi:MAG: ATP-binding cassette domain-containing protein [Granulosicoccus sp.]|nr:ATP-binding cassette domain-containing protein [Granulosicoccus sp.]
MAEQLLATESQRQVRPVTGSGLHILRAGRVLLSVPTLRFSDTGCTVIVGPNGAGKSLLVRSLCGLTRLDSGTVFWAGTPPDSRRRLKVGLLLQRPVLLRRTALQNVLFALKVSGMGRREAIIEARSVLEDSGLGMVAEVAAHRLSGGEQQRVALARALALKPDMLFLDEATANVDPASTLVIEQQLLKSMQAGLKVVMISHDLGQVRRLADEVVLMHQGRIVEQNFTSAFFEQTSNPVSRRWLAGELLV